MDSSSSSYASSSPILGLCEKEEMFHVIHKVPSGDGPYVRAKQAQKDPEAAIVWFWKAINSGDRVDSALKDMAVVMKQLDRTEEAIEAIRSFRGLCSKQAQESLDNVLIDLYKGNLGWAYMQKMNYMAAEAVYRKAQMIDPDANKACNLALCLMKQGRHQEAREALEEMVQARVPGSDDTKSRNRMEELLQELESRDHPHVLSGHVGLNFDLELVDGLATADRKWAPSRPRRLPVFEEISGFKDQLAC
ncbi:hypothetical protein V2J09_022011 [Rumex salicifolius]